MKTIKYKSLFPQSEIQLSTFEINNRRYLGNKFKLINFIKNTIKNENIKYNSFMDLFGGTGIVGANFNDKNTQIIINDLLFSNFVSYNTWFDNKNYDKHKLIKLINDFNSSKTTEENYFSLNFKNTYFDEKNAVKIGYIREKIENLYLNNEINIREKYILITSLLYALDKIANTCGHYDAFIKKENISMDLLLLFPNIKNEFNENNKIYQMDANELVKIEKADIVYIDPPYNSRQYSDAYHLLENIAEWKKPEVIGTAKKMIERNLLKSQYCTIKAPIVFADLIKNINAKYIMVSYNNMGNKGNSRSQAKITDEEIINILKLKGEVKVFEQNHKAFTTGKSETQNNTERLFLCIVDSNKEFTFIEKDTTDIIIKSPLNYTGGKYKLFPQIKEFFPKNIDKFYDIFSGGANIGINIKANEIICIDKEKILINFFNFLKSKNFDYIKSNIIDIINKYNLSNTSDFGYEYYNSNSFDGVGNYNKDNYSLLKKDFNKLVDHTSEKAILMFYVLIVYSFNNQIRFNNNNHWNMPVGKRDFNNSMKNNLEIFHERINKINIKFNCLDFRNINITNLTEDDFIYMDPPYFITNATYNENNKWTDKDEIDLFDFILKLDKHNIKFALSNVIEHNNIKYLKLENFCIDNKFNINYLDFDYKNSNYQKKDKISQTKEVIITNYKIK